MSDKRETATTAATTTNTQQSAATDTPPADGSTQDVTTTVLALIDQIEALIPGFMPYDKNEARRVGATARFAKDLIPQIITTVTSLPPVGGVNTFDVGE